MYWYVKRQISLYGCLLYKNYCVDGFILSFIKLYTQQDAYNNNFDVKSHQKPPDSLEGGLHIG
jgi:hypothetical protein